MSFGAFVEFLGQYILQRSLVLRIALNVLYSISYAD